MMHNGKNVRMFNLSRMYVMLFLIIIIVVFSLTAGCNRSSNGEADTAMNEVKGQSNISAPLSMIEVVIASLDPIKAGEPFQVHASLVNRTANDLEISHGADLFTYFITDIQGNPIKQQKPILYIDHIGYMTTLKAGQQYRVNGEGFRSREYYEFIITEPGSYRVKAVAHFRVEDNGKTHEMELESKQYEFIVN